MAQPKISNKRPKAGEVLPNEPTEQEILEGATNAPATDFTVIFNNEKYQLTELGFIDWRLYISKLLPAVEKAVKALLPLLTSGLKAWETIKGGSTKSILDIRQAALTGEKELLKETLTLNGFVNITDADVEALLSAGENDSAFASMITQLVTRPVVDVFSQVNISQILLDAAEHLPELAIATLAACRNRIGMDVDRKALSIEIYKCDGFELFDIVMKQILLYQERGKLRSFFEQVKTLIWSKIPKAVTGTPTV